MFMTNKAIRDHRDGSRIFQGGVGGGGVGSLLVPRGYRPIGHAPKMLHSSELHRIIT